MGRRRPSSDIVKSSCVSPETNWPVRSVTVTLTVTTSTPVLNAGDCGRKASVSTAAAISDNVAMDRARKLRLIGMLVMLGGVVTAAIIYWTGSRAAAIDAAADGYTRAQEHQLKAMMGPLAVAMSQWADALTSPLGQALMIAGFAAFVGYMCFRHA